MTAAELLFKELRRSMTAATKEAKEGTGSPPSAGTQDRPTANTIPI